MSLTLTRPTTAQTPVSMIERMTLILDAFDGSTPTLTLLGLAERTGLPRSTVHRILDQMIKLRWLAHAPGGYRLGMRTLELGGLAADHNEIRDTVSPLLHELCQRTGMVGHLAVLDGRDVLYLDKNSGRHAVTLPTRLGARMPAHSTAVGKAILATLEPSIVEAAFRDHMTSVTDRTLTDVTLLHRELAQIRTRHGVAVDREEAVPGIACVAAPIRHGRATAVAAISLSGQANGLNLDRLARVTVETAHEASRLLLPRRTWR